MIACETVLAVCLTSNLQVIIVHKLISKFSIRKGRPFVVIATVRLNHNERTVMSVSSRKAHTQLSPAFVVASFCFHFFSLCTNLVIFFVVLLREDSYNWSNQKEV